MMMMKMILIQRRWEEKTLFVRKFSSGKGTLQGGLFFTAFGVRACDRSASASHTASAQHTGSDIGKRHLDSKLVSMKRMPKSSELLDVSKRLSNDQWKNVARRLGVADEVIERIKNDETSSSERAYQMLTSWIQSQYDAATVGRLCEALMKENRTDIARKVFQPKTRQMPLETAV